MSLLHDKHNRWYCIFIVVLVLLLVLIGITVIDTQTAATKEMFLTHDNAIATSLLKQGVSNEVIATALTNKETDNTGNICLNPDRRSNIMEKTIRRGDIYYADLNPVIGSEQGGTRPVLIISNDTGNKHSPTVIIAAITSRVRTKAKLPTHTAIKDFEGLSKDSVILLEQIRTIDKKRLRDHIGMLDSQQILTADKALLISLGLDKKD